MKRANTFLLWVYISCFQWCPYIVNIEYRLIKIVMLYHYFQIYQTNTNNLSYKHISLNISSTVINNPPHINSHTMYQLTNTLLCRNPNPPPSSPRRHPLRINNKGVGKLTTKRNLLSLYTVSNIC